MEANFWKDSEGMRLTLSYDPARPADREDAAHTIESYLNAVKKSGRWPEMEALASGKATGDYAYCNRPNLKEDQPPANREVRFKAAVALLREYLERYGDPHTSITVTLDGATEMRDERRVMFE